MEEINDFLTEMKKTGILIIPSALYMYVDGFGYGRHAMSSTKTQSLQEWFFREVSNSKFTKGKYSAKLKEMLETISKDISTGDLGFTGKYGVDGPGSNITADKIKKTKRGPFFYTSGPKSKLTSLEIGKPPSLPDDALFGKVMYNTNFAQN